MSQACKLSVSDLQGIQKQQSLSRRLLAQKFLKRKASLLKKGNELKELCEAEVYIVVYRHGKYHVYSSSEQPSWPPSPNSLVGQE